MQSRPAPRMTETMGRQQHHDYEWRTGWSFSYRGRAPGMIVEAGVGYWRHEALAAQHEHVRYPPLSLPFLGTRQGLVQADGG